MNLKKLLIALTALLTAGCSATPASSTVQPTERSTSTPSQTKTPSMTMDSRITPAALTTPGTNGAMLTIYCKPNADSTKVDFDLEGRNLGAGTYVISSVGRGGVGTVNEEGLIKTGDAQLFGVGLEEATTFVFDTANMKRTVQFTGGCRS